MKDRQTERFQGHVSTLHGDRELLRRDRARTNANRNARMDKRPPWSPRLLVIGVFPSGGKESLTSRGEFYFFTIKISLKKMPRRNAEKHVL